MPSLSRLSATRAAAAFAVFLAFIGVSGSALAASDIFEPGQPLITGFPGVVALEEIPDGSDPLDYTFIDIDGYSLVIQPLQPEAPPEGQLIETPSDFRVSAADVGLVFGIALDDAPEITGADAPNIYLSATSAFGLNIAMPDADGNPVRTRTGDPAADWMAGQWGSADGATGYPGSIWKVDGTTGEISLFTKTAGTADMTSENRYNTILILKAIFRSPFIVTSSVARKFSTAPYGCGLISLRGPQQTPGSRL